MSQVLTSRWSSRRVRSTRAGLALVVAGLAFAGCSEVESETATEYEPASLEEVAGRDDVMLVKFTEEGAERVAVESGRIAQAGGKTAVPYAAVLYDPEGKTYVYTVTAPREFLREAVVIDRVDGARALLSDGPPAGTEVVTTGAAEVYGAELEIAGSH
jgi:hypothetical protein